MALPNLILLTNLGCEMLFIIEQRLMAQNIAKDKSAQGEIQVDFPRIERKFSAQFLVLREVTTSLLSPQFFQYVTTTFKEELISIAQVRILLSDIACCSLMRLDHTSLDKLLDLMIMVFKWQMFLMSNPGDLLNITLRHLHGIGRLMPEQAKMILIDQANQFFVTHWNELNNEHHYALVRKLNKFLAPFNIRISLLIRMKLQHRDGSFVDKIGASHSDFFRYYIQNLGENIYEKIAHFPHCQMVEVKSRSKKSTTNEIDCLFQQFNVDLMDNRHEDTSEKASSEDVLNETEIVEQNSKLDELKKKCKFDLEEEAPPVYEDNFEELMSMLDGNTM